jgi:hypothetical protein
MTSSGALDVHSVSFRSLLDRPRIDSPRVQRHVRDREKEKPGYLPQRLEVVTAIGTELQISFALVYERRCTNAIESRVGKPAERCCPYSVRPATSFSTISCASDRLQPYS